MLINADFSVPASLTLDQYRWIASPQSGVERVMLDRIGAEQARATSIVRYAADSYFPAHHHPAGEEILVLSGTFADQQSSYPAGWYLRNPPDSSHQPFSEQGATIFVKLQQMPASEQQAVRINTQDPSTWQPQAVGAICPLFAADYEQVCLQRLAAKQTLTFENNGGAEWLVLEGEILSAGHSWRTGSWRREPAGKQLIIQASDLGATLYIKTGLLIG